eukprot:m.92189 g.92189  ORF g.92189 m.92189 type:complete len:316 (-) comp20224_c1_seq3:1608-2555(-)
MPSTAHGSATLVSSAEAGHPNFDLGSAGCLFHQRLHSTGGVVLLLEALGQPSQSPNIVRVRECAHDWMLQVIPIHLFCVGDHGGSFVRRRCSPCFLQEQRAKGVPHWLHPPPRLVVYQCLLKKDGLFQQCKRGIGWTRAKCQLSRQHFLGNSDNRVDRIVHEHRVVWEWLCGFKRGLLPLGGRKELRAGRRRLLLSRFDRESNPAAVVQHHVGVPIEAGIRGDQLLQTVVRKQVIPSTEPNVHVEQGGDKPSENPHSSVVVPLLASGLAHDSNQISRRFLGNVLLPAKHGSEDQKMDRVTAINGVKSEVPKLQPL